MMPKCFLIFAVASVAVQARSSSSDLVSGKYIFESQDNYPVFLEAEGVPKDFQQLLVGGVPDITIERVGDSEIHVQYLMKEGVQSMTLILGQENDVNMLGFTTKRYMINLDDDNNLNAYEVSHPEVGYFSKFTTAGYNATMRASNGVTATQSFRRA